MGLGAPLQYISFTEDPLRNLGILIIPSVILGTALSAGMMRMTRTMMLEVLRQDYIRTARSKGLKDGVVIMRHAVKNALIPIVTLVGMQLPILVGGSVIMESIFNLPGIGRSPGECTHRARLSVGLGSQSGVRQCRSV